MGIRLKGGDDQAKREELGHGRGGWPREKELGQYVEGEGGTAVGIGSAR